MGLLSRLAIGRNAEGRLEIFEGGGVDSTGLVIIAEHAWFNGRVLMFGVTPDAISTWTNARDVFAGGSQGLAGGNGSIFVGPLSRVEVAGDIKIWGTGSATGRPTR